MRGFGLFILTLIGIIWSLPTYSQVPMRQIHGQIHNQHKDTLIGASIDLDSVGNTVAVSDSLGHFQFSTTLSGQHLLIMRYTSYKPDSLLLKMPAKDTFLTISLHEAPNILNNVSVRYRTFAPDKPLLGYQKIDLAQAQYVPVIFGEKDILKTIQLYPGIKSAGDGNTGFYVRGGSSDQNLVLLDGATVYNASHLFGFFSMFNSDVLGDVSVYKGDFPANYGGRLSSVLDITSRDGNAQEFKGSASLGVIASHLSLEGPLKKDKGAILFSARRTYVDAFLKMYPDSSISNNVLNFYDINAKAYYKFDSRNMLYASYYQGRDNLGLGSDFGMNWGNKLGSLRFFHQYSNRLISNTYLTYSGYDYNIEILQYNNTVRITSPFPEYPFSFDYKFNPSQVKVRSTIQDYGLRHLFQYGTGESNMLNFGFSTILHAMRPSSLYTTLSSSYNTLIQDKKHGLESAAWITHNHKIGKKWELHYGVRASLFQVIGPGTYYHYDANGNITDSSIYKNSSIVSSYFNIEPRINVGYDLTENTSLKIGYSRNTQSIHMLSNLSSSTPTDIWLPTSNNIKPEIADQISAGVAHKMSENVYDITSEVYYKKLRNQIDYKNGADLQANPQVEGQLLYGDGRAYGWETLIRKNKGRLTGWVGYTLARTEKRISGINSGKYYPANQDRTHEISIVAVYKYNSKWTFATDFVFYTGNATTYPIGRYMINGMIINYYGDRNQNRMPNYHRLDLSATLLAKKTDKIETSWIFALYNAYGRENAYSIEFIKDPNNSNKSIAQQTSLFRWVPSISYNVKF